VNATEIGKQCGKHNTGAAEITPTFQRGLTNKWYEVSSKMFISQI
jgi:hypothetical protein